MLNDELLEDFINRFFGYGDLTAPIWFVGMEEGGAPDADMFNGILDHWADEGKQHSMDIAQADVASGNERFKSDKPAIQRTWGQLIRAALIARGEEATRDAIRTYQATRLARSGSEACLLELMPLRAQKSTSWNYDKLSTLPYLQSRLSYMDHVASTREATLTRLIAEHSPQVVVFYSLMYERNWQRIVGNTVDWNQHPFGKVAQLGDTTFYCVQHPTAFGVKNSDFEALGEHMRGALS